jgi:hypothetical protein
MCWWKNQTPTDPESHEAYGTLYLIYALLIGASWLVLGRPDWQTGLLLFACLAVAIFYFWRGRVQFSLYILLTFMTYTAVVIGAYSTLYHLVKQFQLSR